MWSGAHILFSIPLGPTDARAEPINNCGLLLKHWRLQTQSKRGALRPLLLCQGIICLDKLLFFWISHPLSVISRDSERDLFPHSYAPAVSSAYLFVLLLLLNHRMPINPCVNSTFFVFLFCCWGFFSLYFTLDEKLPQCFCSLGAGQPLSLSREVAVGQWCP